MRQILQKGCIAPSFYSPF